MEKFAFTYQFHTNISHPLYENHIAPWRNETFNKKCLRKKKVLENLNRNHQKLNIASKNAGTSAIFLAMCLNLIFGKKRYFPVKNQIYCYILTLNCPLKIGSKLLRSRNGKKRELFPTFELSYNWSTFQVKSI